VEHFQEDERREAQYDPRNKRSAAPKRLVFSFWWIVLAFLALGLTALLIMLRTQLPGR
jgi:hypothetical protein